MRVILNAVRLMTLASAPKSASGSASTAFAHDAGPADADVDDAVGLADAVERARHERVVLDGVAEHDELGAADAVAIGGALGSRAR